MRGRALLGSVVRVVARRPLLAVAAVAALALGGAALASRLEPSAGTDTLVSSSSSTARANEAFKRKFGDESVVVLVTGSDPNQLQRTLFSADLGRLIRLEGCLSGNVPERGLRELPRECRAIAELDPARVVLGPGTFVNTSVNRIGEELMRRRRASAQRAERVARSARALSERRGDSPAQQRRQAQNARRLVEGELTREVLQLALRYGITGVPSIDNPDFVDTLVFQRPQGGRLGVPKARFAYLFPSPRSAVIQVRLRPDLTDSERSRAIELIRAVSGQPDFRPTEGARYVVTGVPVVVDALAAEVRDGIVWLLGASLLVMAATLAIVFRTSRRLRLLPLALALAGAAITFGVLSLAGGSLTMATIAVLPVLIGLAVDYAIQLHARFDEESRGARLAAAAAARAAATGGPTIVTAALATAAGFLVLLLSPVPMVREFGLLLVVGIALALACAFTAGFAALVRLGARAGRRPADLPPVLPRLRERLRLAGAALAGSAAGRGARRRGRRLRLGALERCERALAAAVARPRRVLAVGLAVGVLGLALDTQTDVVSDVRELVPRDLQALRDVELLQRETGVSGEIDVTIDADDVTRPEVIAWMARFQESTLKASGYSEGDRCGQARDPPDLCPALSLTTLLSSVDTGDQAKVRGLLDAVPPYFSQGVVTRDRRTANLAFGIRLQSLSDQKAAIDGIRERLDPPAGVQASVVGLPVLAAEANAALESPVRRALMLVLALAAVFCILLAFPGPRAARGAPAAGEGRAAPGPRAARGAPAAGEGRSPRHRRTARDAAIPLIPIALATGWSGGLLFMLGLLPGPLEVDLNPMSVTLGALVIAISTEFSVLLSRRYREEREAGAAPARALELTYASTGAAVLASGATAVAGFGTLIASDIRMLRDFGILTVVDLTVSLIGVMLVLPAALVWAEQHGPFALSDLDPRSGLDRLRARLGRAPQLRAPRLPRPSSRALRARASRGDDG